MKYPLLSSLALVFVFQLSVHNLRASDFAVTTATQAHQAPSIIKSDPEYPGSSIRGEHKSDHDVRMAWWRNAKFGMFIHWGVYSVPAGYYHGKPVEKAGEWIMNNAKIPVVEYREFAREFNPLEFDATKFVSAAKSAGMKYIIITAKHHDGFAMFDTKVSDWSIVRASPYRKDPLKELAVECRKQGVRLGFYYSQAQDWNNGGSAAHGGHWDKTQDRDMDDYLDRIAIPQIRELLSNYGSDTPAVVWWDTPVDMNPKRAERIQSVVQSLRPGVIQNDRLNDGKEARLNGLGVFPGDTSTPEQFIPPRGFPGRDWETCMTMNGTWGFKKDDTKWKTAGVLIRSLCDIVSKGGNFLLNVGPDEHGLIPQESLERLAEIGDWMKINGEAIYGSGPTPFSDLMGSFSSTEKDNDGKPRFIPEWNWRATTKPGHIYLMIFDWPRNNFLTVPTLSTKILAARILAEPDVSLTVTQDSSGTTISGLPTKAPDKYASVIVLDERSRSEIQN